MHWQQFSSREALDTNELTKSCEVNEFEAHKLIHAIAGNRYHEATKSCFIAMQDGLRRTGWSLSEMKAHMLEQVTTELSQWIVLACSHDLNQIQNRKQTT